MEIQEEPRDRKRKGIIIYKSKYGATRKYVEWLVDETGFDTVETSNAKISEIQKYEVILFGGGIYATGIAGISFLRKNIKSLQGKRIIVFCDGASPLDEDEFEEIKKHNMKAELKDIPCFYCRGGWDLEAMSFIDKNMCKMLKKSVSKKDPKELKVWEKALVDAGDEKCDWTDKKYLKPILEAIYDN